MDALAKDRDFMYRLIIGQLYHDGHNQLALDLSNSIGVKLPPPPSDRLFRLVSTARPDVVESDEEQKDSTMQISLNSVIPSIESLTIDEDCGDYFPFMALPTELISHVLSYLPMQDRMRARVNKRLNTIELESKYFVKNLLIAEMSADSPDEYENRVDWTMSCNQRIMLYTDKSYALDGFKRIVQNVSIGDLYIRLFDSNELNRDIFNMIKEFKIEGLYLRVEDSEIMNQMMVDSFLLDLTRVCKRLHMKECRKITAECLHEIYKKTIEGSMTQFLGHPHKEQCIAFLKLIGIAFRDGIFYSNRDLEVYGCKDEEDDLIIAYAIFDGCLLIVCSPYDDIIIFKSYGTQESLEEEKRRKGYFRIDISPE